MGILLIKLINGLAWGKITGNHGFDMFWHSIPKGDPVIFPSNHFFDTVQSLHLDCCFHDFSSIPFYQYQGGEVNVDNAQLFNGQAPLHCSWSPSSPQIGEMCSSSCGDLNGGNQLWPESPLLCSHPYELLCSTTSLCLKIDCQENSLMVNNHLHHGQFMDIPPFSDVPKYHIDSKSDCIPACCLWMFMSQLLVHNTKQVRYNNMQSYETYVIIINHTSRQLVDFSIITGLVLNVGNEGMIQSITIQ